MVGYEPAFPASFTVLMVKNMIQSNLEMVLIEFGGDFLSTSFSKKAALFILLFKFGLRWVFFQGMGFL